MKTLEEKDVTFTIRVSEEEVNPAEQFSTGDDEADAETVADINRRRSDGDVWAWCTVEVTAIHPSGRGVSVLGCCSYESEASFREDVYFDQMKTEALSDLNTKRQNIFKHKTYNPEMILAVCINFRVGCSWSVSIPKRECHQSNDCFEAARAAGGIGEIDEILVIADGLVKHQYSLGGYHGSRPSRLRTLQVGQVGS